MNKCSCPLRQFRKLVDGTRFLCYSFHVSCIDDKETLSA
uniref:Uncharacterized protein n=1 Tax=Arundo donax TaxID=35708 RepID=A0A0A9EUZ2_ARUDO